MPGTFTHWLIVDQALEQLRGDQSKVDLALLVNDYKHWAYLGAQGPDYAYACQIEKREGAHWADALCREMGNCIRGVLNGRGPLTKDENALVAWYVGFLSHVLGDAYLHPVVKETVGPYDENKAAHRACEMVQDTMLWQALRQEPPAYGSFLDRLKTAQGGSRLPALVRSSWHHGLSKAYPEEYLKKKPDIYDWHKYFLKGVRFRGSAPAIFRHAGGEKGIFYRLPKEIPSGELTMYYESVRTPQGTTEPFRPLFDRAVAIVAGRWWEAYLQITGPAKGLELTFLLDWDLDTGVPTAAPDSPPSLWV